MAEQKPVIRKIIKLSREFVQMVFDFGMVVSFQNRQEPDFSIDNAAQRAQKWLEAKGEVAGMFLGDTLVGFSFVHQKPKKEFWLEAIFISSGLRNQGLGSLLFKSAQNKARKAGGDGLRIAVYDENSEVIAFLEKMEYAAGSGQN
jgi:ribosomal protein S18 acetylase RimI-like enzyme